ncbi:unnamed protein product [Bursaphelenchus xylophilus]|uniref:(pine wood nematode) hypothetical protein n=1 Tax=Bursaphelenchus xylophilus TaxID=6326 RepID=A0A1I7RWP1_BURXY|nr:unnamed protein product [Bursaphelenchus xylophilus]CAG9128536.1 unnamed protein product [Bursaphelenchus xylophilus]
MLPAALYGQLAPNAFADPLLQATMAANLVPQTSAAVTISTNSNGGQAADSSASTTPTGSRDTTFTKIFVGGLPYHTTDQTLHDYFKQFGEIEEAVVITDRQTQKSRGYGFVTMKEKTDAEKACRDPNPIIDGRKANVNLAVLGAKPRNNVNLSAFTTALAPQLQLQQQLQLLQGRLGVQQLYSPVATTAAATGQMINPLAGQLNQQMLAAIAQAQMQQLTAHQMVSAQQPQAQLAALPQANQAYLNYAALLAQQQQQQQAQPTAAELAAQFQAQTVAAASNSLTYRKEREKHRVSPY